ncbi:MAG TPA: SelT/SelW/SelH family protein [Flavitalea sp.]|nr:SelT/SelW/SelH family protein [Flavitalea sp.]
MNSLPINKPVIKIEYCPKCRWMLRAAYMAQEFLTTFEDIVGGVMLIPSEVNGRFFISVDERIVYDRKASGGFKEIKDLKQLVRDVIAPGMALGHSDKS